ncbi:hypothetical protein BU52_18365 [Streptomyces toyocaensis]|uniref:Secreted protein n=1 Tax=Streptomyces toyocaensis TaxID=55952 RepID=A0A081XQE8_STRTO|nr:hypothetical protein [Streptomyces toyocaensis]KES05771.1 hypothetical protein BU52_18365 [Streptomyces toyocaensis]
MRALPARRIAFGALCAALLAGTTGPAAMAADSAPVRGRAASSAELLAQVGRADAHKGELAPVVHLVKAVLEADGGRLAPDRARELGDAARAAVAGADDDGPSTTISMTTVTTTTATSSTGTSAVTPALVPPATAPVLVPPATVAPAVPTGVLLPAVDTADPTSDALDAVREALEDFLDLLLPEDDTTAAGQADDQEPSAVDDLLARIDELVDALTGVDTEVSTLPAPAGATTPASTTPATLPALTPLLQPAS